MTGGRETCLLAFNTKRKEVAMQKPIVNYESLIRITKAISMIRDPEEIVLITVEGVKHALNVKGCTLFLFSAKSDELKLAGSYGLSNEYLAKGPISSLRSIASALQDRQPVGIFDVSDDPRIQYPEAAKREGIASILSVPIIIGSNLIGCMRVYTEEPWEFTLNDVNFVQAVAQIFGMALELCRINKGLKDSIDILKTMRDPKTLKSKRRTPYESVPKSFSDKEMSQASV
jgi:signal transduction protein with GAF and PtsI domain